jgi:hypothetical protein
MHKTESYGNVTALECSCSSFAAQHNGGCCIAGKWREPIHLEVLPVFVNAFVCVLSSAQAAIMASICVVFELETLSLCTLRSAVVGVEEV